MHHAPSVAESGNGSDPDENGAAPLNGYGDGVDDTAFASIVLRRVRERFGRISANRPQPVLDWIGATATPANSPSSSAHTSAEIRSGGRSDFPSLGLVKRLWRFSGQTLTNNGDSHHNIGGGAAVGPEPRDVHYDGKYWVVANVGKFRKKAAFTFHVDVLPDGLETSYYTVNDKHFAAAPFNRQFRLENVNVEDGVLQLTVPGGQTPLLMHNDIIRCAEVVTTEEKILHASVRTKATFSTVPGTCHVSITPYM